MQTTKAQWQQRDKIEARIVATISTLGIFIALFHFGM